MKEQIISLAESQVGITETPPGSNHVIYNTEYYGSEVSGAAYPWCCAFIWWLFKNLGASDLFCGGQKTAYCPFVVNYAKQHNQWVTDYQPGDLVLFDWDGDGVADHIGLVTRVVGASVHTVEGNVDEAVRAMQRTTLTIMGAYRPAYRDEPKPEPTPTPTPTKYTVVSGDTLWGIAERFLGAGEKYVQIMSANGLTDSLIYPGQVLVIPSGDGTIYKTIQITITEDTYTLLSIMADGWNKSIGQVIDAMMEDAV